MVAASAFAFVADGKNGLRVLQIVSPWDDPAHFSGFSPRPVPKLIATARTRGPALAISKGIDRDRAVDESGNQLAVFGRRGARPLNNAEIRCLYLHGRTGAPYTVTDQPVESRNSHAETAIPPLGRPPAPLAFPAEDSQPPSRAQISALRLNFAPAYLKHGTDLAPGKAQNQFHPLYFVPFTLSRI